MWSRISEACRPRVTHDAARTAALLYAFGSLIISLETWVIPAPTFSVHYRWVPGTMAVLFGAGALLLWRRGHRAPPLLWIPIPCAPIGAILFMALASNDPSASSQLAFCWPVLFAAYHLRPTAARAITGLVLVAEITLCVTIDPPKVIGEDAVGVSVIFVALMVTLVHARERVDAAIRNLRHDAEHDAVTGLLSRRTFDHDIEHIDDQAVALVVIDIDDFKSVNDSFGHAVGDDVLRIVASCIASNRRQSDSAYRLGGDELAVLLRGCPPQIAVQRAEAIRQAVEASPALWLSPGTGRTGTPRRVTVSLGVACLPEDARHHVELLAIADAAMYAAKEGGRNRVVAARSAA